MMSNAWTGCHGVTIIGTLLLTFANLHTSKRACSLAAEWQ